MDLNSFPGRLQIFLMFIPKFGEDDPILMNLSDGLKLPTSLTKEDQIDMNVSCEGIRAFCLFNGSFLD